MSMLESLPTVIGTAAVAPALLILWIVIAAGDQPGSPTKVWTRFPARWRQHFAARVRPRAIRPSGRDAGQSVAGAGHAFHLRRGIAGRDRQDPGHCRGFDPPPNVRRPDGPGHLWRGRRTWFCGLRKSRLSDPACGHLAVAGGVAQRADGSIPWRAGHHSRRLHGDRADRHRARREPAQSRLGPHVQLDSHVDRTGRAACRLRLPAADAAEVSRPRSHDATCGSA